KYIRTLFNTHRQNSEFKFPEKIWSARSAVYLRCVEELKPREISEILGESANVISVRISRGLEQLRALLHLENAHPKAKTT
ncbi:MAG: sigma factor-like helix-turn-helix DNA-binding protein, partial [Patescibacteria group bacterium]